MAPLFVGSNSDDSRIRSDRVGLAASTSNPASADTGDAYYNSTDNKLNVYDGSDWAEAGGGGTLSGIASGTIPNGATVIIHSDGKVGVITQTGADSLNLGSSVVFESATVGTSGGAAYDSANQKVVIVYRDAGNSSQGTAVVGTVSGNSISFGTPVVFETGYTSESRVVYDSTNEKVVIAFIDYHDSSYGKAVVGTVSGTSISFGSITTFESATLSNLEMTYDSSNQRVVIIWRKNDGVDYYGWSIVGTVSGTSISFGTKVVFYNGGAIFYYNIAYDSSNQKVVITYRDHGNSFYGTAVVGTVSGTSISFGTPVVYESDNSDYNAIAYDSSNQKVVIAYRDSGNSGYGTAVVGTVSGTSISFGTPVVFNSASTSYILVVYDSTNNKVVIAYRDGGNSSYGTAVNGTVSGTSISFGPAIVYQAYDNYNIALAYDSDKDKIVIAYRDSNNSNYGTVKVGDSDSLSTNLTSSNFLGFSDAAYSDGDTVNIQIEGSVDDAQSGLTTARKHYVQNDGTLSTTAGNPSVPAGTAISGTKIIIET